MPDVSPASVLAGYDGFDLDQEILFDQPVDDQQRVRRVERPGKDLREQRGAEPHEVLDILGMHEVRRELHDIVEAGADSLEHAAEVVEHLLELPVEVALPGDAAVGTDGELSGDVVQ